MTHIEVEHECRSDTTTETTNEGHTDTTSDDELVNELVKDAVKGDVLQNVIEANEGLTDEPKQELNKPVKQLTKAERETIINEFNNGVDNKFYKVSKLKNGSIRITKRANPLTNNSEESLADAHENVNKRIDNKLNTKRLTDNQLLLEHIIDLEKRYEVMRMKHKKLKKRYNKLECDLFEDEGLADSDEPLNIKEITQDNAQDDVQTDVKESAQTDVQNDVDYGFRTVKRPIRKQSWRTVVSGF